MLKKNIDPVVKKFVTIIGIPILGALIAIIAAYLPKKEPIAIKFCYIYINTDSIHYVSVGRNRSQAHEFMDYYLDTTIKYAPNSWRGGPGKYTKVEVLKYSRDSLVAKIRFIKYDPRGYPFYSKGWVPSFTLHDTLPENLKHKEKRVVIHDDKPFDGIFDKSTH